MTAIARNFEALDATEPYDVCVIGAGLAGTVLGVRLVRCGLRVLLVDSGSTEHAAESDVWRGICERLDPADLRVHPYNRRSNPWPIGYADLEPHYRAAERMLRVRQAPPSPGRRLPHSRYADPAFAALLRRHGIDAKGAARATPGRGRATFAVSRELLPELVASRTGTFVSGVKATRLRSDGNGRVIGAVCRAPDGTSKTARAHTYVVAAGALETPRLLLLSRSQRFPHGLGNDFDRVGRGVTDQTVVSAHGLIERLGHRPRSASPLHTEQFHQMFRRDGLGAVHPFFERSATLLHVRTGKASWRNRIANACSRRETFSIACRVELLPVDENRVVLSAGSLDAFGDPRPRCSYHYAAEDLELIARTRAWLERWLERLGASGSTQNEVEWAGSLAGTCRMGADPRSSVCDSTLRVHSSPNLYVCGAETFPRGGAVPPALTVAALAHRLADHISARARWCARATPKPTRAAPVPTVAAAIPLVRRRPQP